MRRILPWPLPSAHLPPSFHRQRMRLPLVSASATASLLLAIGLGTGCRAAPPGGIALGGVSVIGGSGGPALPDAAVVVRRGRVESVGTRAGFTLPARTVQVDVTN